MARSVNEIKNILGNAFISNATIFAAYGLAAGLSFAQQFSLVSIENILFDTIAYSHNLLENLWDVFRAEITAEMARQQPHTKDWYRNKALGFLFGVPLIANTDRFDTTGLTDEQTEAASIVKQAAAVKLVTAAGYGILRVKVATANGNALAPLNTEQLAALRAYMNQVVDAGTQLQVTSGEADKLRLVVDVYYDPLVLSSTGARLDGTAAQPVNDAIAAFLSSIAFNGTYNKKLNEAAIMEVPGVEFANITAAASKYAGYSYEDTTIQNAGAISMFRTADAGYFTPDQVTINYRLQE